VTTFTTASRAGRGKCRAITSLQPSSGRRAADLAPSANVLSQFNAAGFGVVPEKFDPPQISLAQRSRAVTCAQPAGSPPLAVGPRRARQVPSGHPAPSVPRSCRRQPSPRPPSGMSATRPRRSPRTSLWVALMRSCLRMRIPTRQDSGGIVDDTSRISSFGY
jgi:hypothetical protein